MKRLIKFKNTAFYTFAAMLLVAVMPASAGSNTAISGTDDRPVHVVDQGEILWCIAHHTYGDPRAYIDIHQANPHLEDPDRIRVGERLRLPGVVQPLDTPLPQGATACCRGTFFINTPGCRNRGKQTPPIKPAFSITTQHSGAIKAILQNTPRETRRPGVAPQVQRPSAEHQQHSEAVLSESQRYQFVIDGNDNPTIIQIHNDQPYYGVSHE